MSDSDSHILCWKCRGLHKKDKCPECGNPKQETSILCSRCNAESLHGFGDMNKAWKGGRVSHHGGYVMIRNRNHPRAQNNNGYVFEHILVMEDSIGRYLDYNETVHHVNGIKDDNRPENLELWTSPQPSGIRSSDAVDWAIEILKKYSPDLLR
jgi:hypothetical protein